VGTGEDRREASPAASPIPRRDVRAARRLSPAPAHAIRPVHGAASLSRDMTSRKLYCTPIVLYVALAKAESYIIAATGTNRRVRLPFRALLLIGWRLRFSIQVSRSLSPIMYIQVRFSDGNGRLDRPHTTPSRPGKDDF
jgi:hypothetical protein